MHCFGIETPSNTLARIVNMSINPRNSFRTSGRDGSGPGHVYNQESQVRILISSTVVKCDNGASKSNVDRESSFSVKIRGNDVIVNDNLGSLYKEANGSLVGVSLWLINRNTIS